MSRMRVICAAILCAASLTALNPAAQQLTVANSIRQFVKADAPVMAIDHVRVIDGTGAPARADQTVVLKNGVIVAVGASGATEIPAGATVIDGIGKSLLPGMVMVHEHLYYPAGSGIYGTYAVSFARLYLAGGVTTMRTGGNLDGFLDINLMRRSERGEVTAPAIDATAPYINGANTFLQMGTVESAAAARQHVNYWADAGATSFKAYMQISRAALGAAIETAHQRGLKVTGHLCSVTYAEAAALGIDNLEHGFAAATDFVASKAPDVCPSGQNQQTVAALTPESEPFQALVRTLVARKVALTSTLTVFEMYTPRRPMPPGLDVLIPQLRDPFVERHQRLAASASQTGYAVLFPKLMQLELAFVKAGGLLIAGTDPTGPGGVVPGFSNQRQLELLVEAGFSPVDAIKIGTLNGARYLGRESRIGSIAVGKQADLILVTGDPATTIADVRRVDTVFRQGVGFDAAKLIESVKGRVGLW
jgi:imidazolonepropionase-like amidohydrolase